jgi:hypothetical protein
LVALFCFPEFTNDKYGSAITAIKLNSAANEYQIPGAARSLLKWINHVQTAGVNPPNTGTDLDYDGAAFRLAIPIDFDSMFGECKYQDGKLTEVILHPIDQGYALPQADRGTPRAAHGEAAQRILQHVQDISKQFGTKIDIEGEVGVIHVAADTADK